MLFCSNVLWVWVRRSDEMIDARGSLLLTLGFYVLCPLLISAQENLNAINTTHKVKQIPRNTIKFFNGSSHTGANTLSPCTVFCLFWPTPHAHKITSSLLQNSSAPWKCQKKCNGQKMRLYWILVRIGLNFHFSASKWHFIASKYLKFAVPCALPSYLGIEKCASFSVH